jgi:hypothetical protein
MIYTKFEVFKIFKGCMPMGGLGHCRTLKSDFDDT